MRSLHTRITEVCYKQQFFISLTCIEKFIFTASKKEYEMSMKIYINKENYDLMRILPRDSYGACVTKKN